MFQTFVGCVTVAKLSLVFFLLWIGLISLKQQIMFFPLSESKKGQWPGWATCLALKEHDLLYVVNCTVCSM